MSTTAKWGVIAAVALITSFTGYYSMFATTGTQTTVTTIFRAIGILGLVLPVFLSIYFNRRNNPAEYDLKAGLQNGMKTALLAISIFSVYNYAYLAYFNPGYIEWLVNARITLINESASEQVIKLEQIKNVKESLTPFKGVTTDVLKLLAISSMASIASAVLVKKYPV